MFVSGSFARDLTLRPQTEIPKLKRYLLQDGERRNLVEAISIIGNFCTMLSHASGLDAKSTSDIHTNQEIVQLLTELEKVRGSLGCLSRYLFIALQKCDARRKTLMVQIAAEYAKIGRTLREAVDEVCIRTFIVCWNIPLMSAA